MYVLYTHSGFLNHSTRQMKKPRFRELTNSDCCHITNNLYEICFFVFFLVMPCGLWDLGSPTRNRTCAPGADAQSSICWTRSEVLTPKLSVPLFFISVLRWSLYCLQSCPSLLFKFQGHGSQLQIRALHGKKAACTSTVTSLSSKQLSLAPGSERSPRVCSTLRMNSKEPRGQMDIC